MKVFMIGGGDIARHHGRAVLRLGGEVIGVYDVSEKSLEIYRKEFGCPSCTYEEIEDYVVKADYVVISTRPPSAWTMWRWCSGTTSPCTWKSPWPAPWRTP